MIGSIFFVFNRLVEIVFLIPIIGMLVCGIILELYLKKTNKIGLLHRRIPQIQPNHSSLNPRPLHRLRGSHLLVPGHPNPTELDQTLRDLRCLRGPVLLRRLHRLRLRTTLHWLRKLQPLVRRLRRTLQIPRPVRTPW